jgi:transposase
MKSKSPIELSQMNRAVFEALDHDQLVELTCRLHRIAIEQAERLAMNSTNSSRPPSSDPPFGTGGAGSGSATGASSVAEPTKVPPPPETPSRKPPQPSGRKPGKQPGAKGKWRDEPLKSERSEHFWPATCGGCCQSLEMWDKEVRTGAAFPVLELVRSPGGIRIACVEHRYQVVLCTCGHETEARPATGVLSFLDGRKRQLHLSERCMVAPSFASFIAALHLRHHQSRRKIREFLLTWMGVPLSVGSIDRCIREVGVACEPVAEELLEEVRVAGLIHADETPWYERGAFRWLWVVLTATTAVFHIGSRRHEEIRDLLGDAIIGWLVTDGYGAYRDYERRQRCLAHLIRKGLALAGGLSPDGIRFGEWLVRELRGLIHAVAEDQGHIILNPIQARLKRACKLHRDHETEKIRALAREILNDWGAIVAFVSNPGLPPTNNEAERALRIAVIARRLSFGTRTEEGSAAYAASLSVVETCRRRHIDPWSYIAETLARARAGITHNPVPVAA